MATSVSLLASGSAGAATTATTGTVTPTGAGILVFICAVENTGTNGLSPLTSLVDSVAARSVGTVFNQKTWSPGSAGSDGVTTAFYATSVPASASAAGTITITATSNSAGNSRKAWAVYFITGFPSGTSFGAGGSATFFGAGISSASPSKTSSYNNVQTDAVTIGFLGIEGFTAPTLDSDTLNGSWSTQNFRANGTTTANSVGLATQYKIGTYAGNTAPSNLIYNPTLGAAVDTQIGLVELIPTIANPAMAAPTVGTMTSTTADLTWVAPWAIWGVTNYLVEYRTTIGPGAWTSIDTASTALSATVTLPNPGTSYDFNIKSVNILSLTSAAGATASGTTLSGAVSTSITAGSISAVTTLTSPSVTSQVSTSITAGSISAVTTLTSPSVTSAIVTTITATAASASSILYTVTTVGLAATSIPSTVVTTLVLTVSPTVLLSNIRYFRPSSDPAVGSWTVAPLWSKVDEVSPYDSDYISSEGITSGTTSIAKLALTLT